MFALHAVYLSCALIIDLLINQYVVFSLFAHIRISFLLSIIKNSVIMKLAYGYHVVVILSEGDMATKAFISIIFNEHFCCHLRSTVRDTGRGSGRQRIFTSEEGQGYDEIKVKQGLNHTWLEAGFK